MYSPPSQRHNSCARHVEQGYMNGMKKFLFLLVLAQFTIGASAQSIGAAFISSDGWEGYSFTLESLTWSGVSVNGEKSHTLGTRLGLSFTNIESIFPNLTEEGYVTNDYDTQMNFSAYLRLFLWRRTRIQIPVSLGIQYGAITTNGVKEWRFGANASAQLKLYVFDRMAFFADYYIMAISMDDYSELWTYLQVGVMIDISK